MINHLRTFFIVSISSFFIILLAPKGFSQQDDEKYILYTKEEIFQNIYKFEKLMNQKKDPTMDEYLQLFDPETLEEEAEYICHEGKYSPPITLEICEEYFENMKDDKKNVSLAFLMMRSSNGRIFQNSKPSKIKIYVYDNFKIDPSKDDLGISIDILIKTEDHIIPCIVDSAKFKSHSDVFGKIGGIYCSYPYIQQRAKKEKASEK